MFFAGILSPLCIRIDEFSSIFIYFFTPCFEYQYLTNFRAILATKSGFFQLFFQLWGRDFSTSEFSGICISFSNLNASRDFWHGLYNCDEFLNDRAFGVELWCRRVVSAGQRIICVGILVREKILHVLPFWAVINNE